MVDEDDLRRDLIWVFLKERKEMDANRFEYIMRRGAKYGPHRSYIGSILGRYDNFEKFPGPRVRGGNRRPSWKLKYVLFTAETDSFSYELKVDGMGIIVDMVPVVWYQRQSQEGFFRGDSDWFHYGHWGEDKLDVWMGKDIKEFEKWFTGKLEMK